MKIFYIAPQYFDTEFDIKYQIIKKIALEHNVQILHGLKSDEKQFDLEHTMQLYNEADFFIADLSFERPSCYYEVGFVQGLDKEVRLIAFVDTQLHQVKGDVLKYSSIKEYEKLIERIIQDLKVLHTTKNKLH